MGCRAQRVASAVLVLLLPNGLVAQSTRRTLTGSHVALFNVAGAVHIARGDGPDVQFVISTRKRDADRLRIETGTVRGLPTLRVIYPDDEVVYLGGPERRWGSGTETRIRDDGTWGGEGWRDRDGQRLRVKRSGRGLEAWADIRVLVPNGTALDSYLLVGQMTATDVESDLRLDVASARVAATDTRGILVIDAGSGGVALHGTRGRRLAVKNGSGGVSLDRVSSEECTVDTGSGGVTLALPSDFGAEIDIETGSGSITTDFAVRTRTLERRHLRGTIGNGTGRVVIESGSGSVRLRRSDM